jgi:hypothetical protein
MKERQVESKGHAMRSVTACARVVFAIFWVGMSSGQERAGRDATRISPMLKVHERGRYLVDEHDHPFLVVGDTAWSLLVQGSPEDIDCYLDDRRKKGFNSIIVNLIEHRFCSNPPRTRAGLAPFTTPGDLSTPNAAYFDFAHEVVRKANDRGIVVWLVPAYLGYGGGDEGWFREIKASGPEKLRAYGRFVAEQFADLPNIVWVMGGDFTPMPADQWTAAALAEAIRRIDSVHLMTGHGSSSTSAVSAFGERPWLTINAVYTYEPTLFKRMLAECGRHPVRPCVLFESRYEDEHDSRPEQIRQQAWWAMLSGACGQFFGNNPIWHLDGPGITEPKMTWQKALDSVGSQDMVRLRKLFVTLPWQRLVPEQGHAIVTDGYGDDVATALTAQTDDRRLSVTYIPSTGMESRTLTVDLTQFAGTVIAQWYDPTNGRRIVVGEPLPADRHAHVFRTPGNNGTGANDWLLILQVM